MAESIREEPAAISANSMRSKLRYPLRSATKSKEEKPPVVDPSNSSASRRGRSTSTLSKSVSVLDLSAKEKSAKPPRRLSIPAKSTVNSAPKSVGNITPISETRAKRLSITQRKSETPRSDISLSSSRKKFNVLSSASYWLNQIKYSESVAKHSISLGFFKLALEAGCEPQKMRDELKSYARRHNLSELGETVKDLFERYNISETLEQLQVSETCSQVPEEGTRSSDDEVHSSSSTVGIRKLKPKSLNTDSAKASPVAESVKKEISSKNSPAPPRTRASLNKNSANSRSVSDIGKPKIQKKPQKPTKQETNKEKDRTKQGKKLAGVEGPVGPPASDKVEENKENMDSYPMEEICA